MTPVTQVPEGTLHHVELWSTDLEASKASLGWLLEQLGYRTMSVWDHGCSWQLAPTYVVIEQSSAVAGAHERTRAGLNHLAFWVATRQRVDQLTAAAEQHGWSLLFPDRHPWAGGPQHYAAYLEDRSGFEVELVAAGPESADGRL